MIKINLNLSASIKAKIKVVTIAVCIAASPGLIGKTSIFEVNWMQQHSFKMSNMKSSVEIYAVDVANGTVQMDMRPSNSSMLILSLSAKQWGVNMKNADYLNREIASVILSSKNREQALERAGFVSRKFSKKTKDVAKQLVNTYYDSLFFK